MIQKQVIFSSSWLSWPTLQVPGHPRLQCETWSLKQTKKTDNSGLVAHTYYLSTQKSEAIGLL